MKVPFFSKRKEKQAEERKEKRLKIEGMCRESLTLIERFEDPTEKIIELQKLSDNIQGVFDRTVRNISAKGAKTVKTTAYGGVGAVGAAGLTGTLLVAASGPIGWGIAGATLLGYGGAAVLGVKRGKSVTENLLDESLVHLGNLQAVRDVINGKINETMAANVDAIANSPLREKLLSMPGLSAKFTAAAEKHLQEIQNVPAAEDKAASAAEEKKNTTRISDPRLLGENVFTKQPKKPHFGG